MRLLAYLLGLIGAIAACAAEAASDPFAPGAQGGFSPKNPTFARYAASEARGFDRIGKPVEFEFVYVQRPHVEGEPWPDEPKPEWLRQEPPQRTVVALKLFNAGKADHVALLARDPAGRELAAPRSLGLFIGLYAEPSDDWSDAYAVELYFSRSTFEGWVQAADASYQPICSSQEICTRLTVTNRWMRIGAGGGVQTVDGVKTGTENVLYLRAVDGLPPAEPRTMAQEPTTVTPPPAR
jgi:hypothetical protein